MKTDCYFPKHLPKLSTVYIFETDIYDSCTQRMILTFTLY